MFYLLGTFLLTLSFLPIILATYYSDGKEFGVSLFFTSVTNAFLFAVVIQLFSSHIVSTKDYVRWERDSIDIVTNDETGMGWLMPEDEMPSEILLMIRRTESDTLYGFSYRGNGKGDFFESTISSENYDVEVNVVNHPSKIVMMKPKFQHWFFMPVDVPRTNITFYLSFDNSKFYIDGREINRLLV